MSTQTDPTTQTPAAETPASPADDARKRPGGSKINAAMWFSILGGIVLAVLLVFILQNLDRVPIEFLGWSGSVPVGVALLIAAIAGGLIVAIASGLRILQLRHRATGWKR